MRGNDVLGGCIWMALILLGKKGIMEIHKICYTGLV